MTVPSEQSRITYDTDGTSVSFPVPFRFLQNRDLRVTLIAADDSSRLLVLDVDYSVTGAGQQSGGTLSTVDILAAGETLLIERIVPITQETAYQRNDPFPERAHERALDKLTMINQQIGGVLGMTPGSVNRALLLGDTDRDDGSGSYRARGNRIRDVGDPVSMNDAVNKQAMTEALAGLAADGSGEFVVERLKDGERPDNGTGMVFHKDRPIRDRFDESPVLAEFPDVKSALRSSGFTIVQPEDIPALLYVTNPVQIRAENAGEINVTTDKNGAFLFQGVSGALVQGLRFRQRLDQEIAAGLENDFQMLKFRGGAFNRAICNTFNGPLALSFMLGLPVDGDEAADRTSKFNIALGNIAPDNRGMFIETMGALGAIIVANASKCDRNHPTRQHGIRLTGYNLEANGINAPNIGTVGAANVLAEFLTGVSVQNAAQLFDLGNLFITDCDQAVQILSGTARESDPRNGKLSFVARLCQQYIRVGRSKNLTFEFVIDATVSNNQPNIEELSHETPYGGHTYRGTIFGSRTTAQTVLLRHPNATLDIDLDDCANGVTVSATAKGAKGRISVRRITGAGVTISADNCDLVISARNTGGAYAIGVSGNGNNIVADTDGRLLISGSGNKVIGVVEGSISNTGSDNDLSGIKGYSGRGTLPSVTPDSNGDVVINLNSHPNSPRAFQASAWGGNRNLSVFVRSVTSAGVATIRIFDGTNPHTGSCAVSYSY